MDNETIQEKIKDFVDVTPLRSVMRDGLIVDVLTSLNEIRSHVLKDEEEYQDMSVEKIRIAIAVQLIHPD